MARSTEFGGGPIGSVNLAAGGENPLSFRDMPEGPCSAVQLSIGLSIVSTAGAFSAVFDTGSSFAGEGVDDVDLLTNAVYSKLNWFIDKHETPFNLSPAQLRTTLAVLELRDIISTLLNGASIPATGQPVKVVLFTLRIPVQLNHMVEDGNLFANGSERMKTGTLFAVTNSSITPTVVLANGSAVVSANIFRAIADGGVGDKGDVGMTWSMLRQLGLPTVHNFELDRPRLFLADVLPVASNPASAISIGDYESLNPSDFAGMFVAQRLQAMGGAADLTGRITPYIWPSPHSRVDDIIARLLKGPPRLVVAAGITSIGVYDLQVIGASESAQAGVATNVGGGGDVTVQNLKPQSLPNGARVPAGVARFLPKRIVAPSAAAVGTVATPSQVKTMAADAHTDRQTLISTARSKR